MTHKCKRHNLPMVRRPPKEMTEEQRWCGAWYDCPHPGCHSSVLDPSPELRAFWAQHGINQKASVP